MSCMPMHASPVEVSGRIVDLEMLPGLRNALLERNDEGIWTVKKDSDCH